MSADMVDRLLLETIVEAVERFGRPADVAAWSDPRLGAALELGQQRGWSWRVSVTQAGWTQEGVDALHAARSRSLVR